MHAIDVADGEPTRGMRVEVYEVKTDDARRKVGEETDGENGSFDQPMGRGHGVTACAYVAELHVGAYNRARNPNESAPAFLDVAPFRFVAMDEDAHYHLPFRVSP